MNIGVCFLSNLGNSWNMSEGVINALRRLGHTVTTALHIHGDIPASEKPTTEWNQFDFTLILEAEYIPKEYWLRLACPVALWFTETANREDLPQYGNLYRELLSISGTKGFFVAKQDADTYGGVWLPHGVDTETFRPLDVPKLHDISLFGQIYPRRHPTWGMVQRMGLPVHRIERALIERTASIRTLVEDINQSRMILALPAYSHSFTTRPLETLACGVPIVLPRLAEFARCNEAQWHEISPCYYFESDPGSLHMAIEEARVKAPHFILKEVHNYHRLEFRLQRIIEEMSA